MLLALKQAIIYGPVRSRRLGRSLGVNVLPAERKTCSFDCLYCQYGWTDREWVDYINPWTFPGVESVRSALTEALQGMDEPPAWVTFSGHGEPTLHPRFPELVEVVLAVRDRLAPSARVAILSNSSRVTDPSVCQALARLDARIMKLDAGRPDTFRRFNQPVGVMGLERVVEGLGRLADVTLQSLFADGLAGNLWPADVEAWVATVARIRPTAVQIYTLDRDTPLPLITRASRQQLEAVRDQVQGLGVRAEVF